MALITVNPTSNTTPDVGQGGLAVTGATNTGHGSTTATTTGGGTDTASCVWTAFPSVGSQIAAVTLKVDWTQNGSLIGAGAKSNSFRLQYSVNGGGVWTNIFEHLNVTASSSGGEQVVITLPQDLTQIQVRDRLQATSSVDTTASVTGSISNIRLEVTTVDANLVVMM